MKHSSPANPLPRTEDKKRIPMTSGQLYLQTPEIPGYHLHWFLGNPDRIQSALNAFYTFVDPSEVQLENYSIGGDAQVDGNTDLGTRVSVLASRNGGSIGSDGQPLRMYLMKLPLEYHKEDQAALDSQGNKVLQSLKHGTIGADKDRSLADTNARYVKTADFSQTNS